MAAYSAELCLQRVTTIFSKVRRVEWRCQYRKELLATARARILAGAVADA
jgi:hypothetical protein